MPNIVRQPHYRMTVEHPPNSEIEIDVPLYNDPTINETLGSITRVMQVEIADTPDIEAGQECTLYLEELIGGTTEVLFKGVIDKVDAEAFPNRVVWTCVSYKARTRKVPVMEDHDLSGMTDTEAVEYVLDQCNVPYVDADVRGSGYTLGTIEPIYWLKDQPGHEIITMLDEVFKFTTIDVGEGEVIRFPIKYWSDPEDVTHTFVSGSDPNYWGCSRNIGGPDEIINVVNVTGLSWVIEEDDGGDGCERTIWARATGDHEALGDDEFNRGNMIGNEVIQTEALAKRVARDELRRTNRRTDSLTIVALNDVTMWPGRIIGVSDDAYGIELEGDPEDNRFLVTSVDRQGDMMTLQCIGGSAGDYDVLESGIQRICNKNGDTTTTDPAPWEDVE